MFQCVSVCCTSSDVWQRPITASKHIIQKFWAAVYNSRHTTIDFFQKSKSCPNVTTEFCTCQKFGSKIDQGLKVSYIFTHNFTQSHLVNNWTSTACLVAMFHEAHEVPGSNPIEYIHFFAYMLNVRSYSFWKLTQLSLLVLNLSLLKYFDITLSRHKSSKIEGSGPPIMSHSIQFHCFCFHFSTVSKRETVYTRCHMKGVHVPSHLQSFAGV